MASRDTGGTMPPWAEFEQFFQAHHRELARLAYIMTGNHADADDIAADALISAWQRWDRVTAADRPLAYVRRSVVNLSVSKVRRRTNERRGLALLHPLTQWFQQNPNVGLKLDLEAAVLALPPRRRACVVLRHVYGLTAVEVAQTLGISEGAVKSQTWKGLEQLRRMLEEADLSGKGTWSPDPAPGHQEGWDSGQRTSQT